MAPAQPSRRAQSQTTINEQAPIHNDPNVNTDLFVDPMLGTPLSVYIEKDVDDKDELVRLVTAYGGAVCPGYSGVTYILVDPHKISGQNLYRQYAGKKTKLVLNARWIRECIRANQLQTFATQFAGCKVTGEEQIHPPSTSRPQEESTSAQTQLAPSQQQPQEHQPQLQPQASTSHVRDTSEAQPQQHQAHQAPPPPPVQGHPHPPPVIAYGMPTMPTVLVDPINGFTHTVYGHPMHPPPHSIPHPSHWPPHPHMQGPIPPPYRDHQWDYPQSQDGMSAHPNYPREYTYRENHPPWLPSTSNGYYDPTAYDQAYAQAAYMAGPDQTAAEAQAQAQVPMPVDEQQVQPELTTSHTTEVGPSTGTLEPPERTRGRKRTRAQQQPATPATELVNRSTPARSPTPPSRVIKSTYGGNLFTADDVLYLKKYIDYCQEQGLVLSLREICERVAVKAPHHTFYSWRRYCNKHQIKLGGYIMAADRGEGGGGGAGGAGDSTANTDTNEPGPSMAVAQQVPPLAGASRIDAASARAVSSVTQNRTPSPPRALYRSTTGKGVAFTQEDVDFLMKFLRYREFQGRVDMVQFWKDVAAKAPHHSRASWMKFWRRHKHELLQGSEEYEAPPPPPDKKKRYSRQDDILLAKFHFEKPEGTSDKLFQAFARLHPHHPWKGWQEHHRIHKAKIDHLVEMLNMGQSIDIEEPE